MALFGKKRKADFRADMERLMEQSRVRYEYDLENLDEGPGLWLDEPQQLAIGRRLYRSIRKRLDAIEQGDDPVPNPPDISHSFFELERADEDGYLTADPSEIGLVTTFGLMLGLLIRQAEVEDADHLPVSKDFIATLDLESLGTDPSKVAYRLRELASDESAAVVLSLFSHDEAVWNAFAFWADEYVRLSTMIAPGVAICTPDSRSRTVRFGYLLACYLELTSATEPPSSSEDEDEALTNVFHAPREYAISDLRKLIELGDCYIVCIPGEFDVKEVAKTLSRLEDCMCYFDDGSGIVLKLEAKDAALGIEKTLEQGGQVAPMTVAALKSDTNRFTMEQAVGRDLVSDYEKSDIFVLPEGRTELTTLVSDAVWG